jgi:deazaflavin-dependent oxidoreductase (nitroreductase family)
VVSAGELPDANPVSRSVSGARLPYGARLGRVLDPLHRLLIPANRLVTPLLRAGAGALISNPITGHLLLLRTRGRTSGLVREVPLGYVILDGAVYCCAGFGVGTAWYRNVLADDRVEIVFPGRTLGCRATPVTDPAEWLRAYRALMASLGLISRGVLGDLSRTDDDVLLTSHRTIPLVRIVPTSVVAGELDPGGRSWLAAATVWLIMALAGARLLPRRSRAGRGRRRKGPPAG